ncbi:TonB-dependent receptor [Betaproteobacteria bacterium]|nr:TonB-dependent receptor [Betaproteobacteria bacterium]
MNTVQAFSPKPPTERQKAFSFRRAPLFAAMISGFALMSASPLYAADDAEVEALKAEIYRLRQELSAQRGETAPAAAGEAASTAAPVAAGQQYQPEEPQALDAVVVRSRNRIERLQDVPLSISVVTGKELDRLAANDLSEIVKRVGNVSWNRGNQRTFSLSIRGLGKAGQTEAQDPSIGLIVDGVSYAYNALASSYNFHDIEAVEVTRGPQGTLLGKNSSLGSVNFVTRKPSFTPSADYSLLFGEHDRVVGKFAAGGPIVDGLLAYRISAVGEKGNGDIKNRSNKDMSYQNIERFSGRAQFLLTPSTDFSARIALEVTPRAAETTNGRTTNTPTAGLRYSNGTAWRATTAEAALNRPYFQGVKDYSINDYYRQRYVNADSARGLVTGSHGASAELNWQVGSHTLTSITAYRDYHFNAVNDEGTPFDVYRNAGGFWNDYKQRSQEFRISSDSGGFVDYQAGLYYINVSNSVDYQRDWGHDAGAWFANAARYGRLSADAAGQRLLADSLDGLSMSYNSPTGLQKIHNTSTAVFGQANWHLSEPLTLTTGIRLTRENRENYGSSFIRDNGRGGALNPDVVNGVNLGGFNSDATGALGANSIEQAALADAVAQQYFGVANYGALTADQRQQVADAKATRRAAIGVVFNKAKARSFNDIQKAFVLSPSYKVNENLTTYVSAQYGEKAGISQFTNGVSNKIDAEKTTSYEIGFKSALFQKTLILNANLYLTNVKDFQQSVQAYDEYTTRANNDGTLYYTSATGSVPRVQSKGLELDGVYSGIKYTTLRFSGAYTDARYKKFKNAAQPAENGYTGAAPYRDLSGKVLPGASKFTANIGVDYRIPVLNDKEFHVDFNTEYHTKYYSDNALSRYSIIKAGSITDFGIGLGARNQSYDVSLVVKNLFDDDAKLTSGATSYTPALGRWIGIQFTGKL